MSSHPSLTALRKELRKITTVYVEGSDFAHIFDEMLFEGNDRSVALLGAAVLDSMLAVILMAHFPNFTTSDVRIELFERESSPLNSLSAKTKLAYALGIITKKQRDELDLIRAIRNPFAHTITLSDFQTPAIKAMIRRLQFASLDYHFMHSEERALFVASIINLSLQLGGESHKERSDSLVALRRVDE